MAKFGFDRRNGELLVGAAAIDLRQEEAGADVLSLPELLTTPDFPFAPGDFERPKKTWDHESCKEIGQWTLVLIGSSEETPRSIHKEHIRRLSVMGLGPGVKEVTIKNDFTSFTDYKQQIGAPMLDVRGIYSRWDSDEILEYVSRTWGDRRVKTIEVEEKASQGLGPSKYIFEKTLGGINELNELRGFYSPDLWNRIDYSIWGAKVIAANLNDPKWLTTTVVGILSRRDRGPSWRSILYEFDRWSIFREEAREQHILLIQEEKAVRRQLASQLLGKTGLAKMHRRYLSSTDSTVRFILKTNPTVDMGLIESVALEQHVFDTLWPHDNFRQNLQVTEPQLKAARKKAATARRRYPANYVKRSAS